MLLNTTPPGATTASFGPPQFWALGQFADPSSVAVGDFNGDGRPDLAVTSANGYGVFVLINRMAPGSIVPLFGMQNFLTSSYSAGEGVGDINGDGRPDLAVTNKLSNTVSVLLNTTAPGATAPSFAPPQTFGVGSAPVAVAVGDLNGDGRNDLLVANESSVTLSVLLNATAAGATAPNFAAQQTVATGSYPTAVVAGDVNGDGRPDLAVSNGNSNTVSVLLNTTAPGATIASFAPGQTFATAGEPRGLAVADVNGDGRPDLAVTTSGFGSPLADVFLNTTAPGSTTPSFAPQQTFGSQASYGYHGLAVADINGDGKPDLAVAYGDTRLLDGLVSVLLNTRVPTTGVASFAPPRTFAAGYGAFQPAVGDFNGDGKPDVAVVDVSAPNGGVSVLLNTTPPGATAPSFATRQTFATGRNPECVAVGDFNGDGKADLAIANSGDGTVSVLLNTTAPGATAPSFALPGTFAAGFMVAYVAVGDFNGDGKADLAIANSGSGTVSVLLNTTSPGATTPSFALPQTFATGSNPSSVAVGDFNGDGKPDLVTANYNSTGGVSVLLNTTPPGASFPSFAPQVTFAAGTESRSVAVADLNGDGKPDLAVADYSFSSGAVSVLLNTTSPGAAAPSFALPSTVGTGSNPFAVTVGDFNGDGQPDLVTTSPFNSPNLGTVSVLLSTTPPGATAPSFALPRTFAVDSNTTYPAVGDFNGDGKPDLVTAAQQNTSLDHVSVLLNTEVPITLSGSPATGTISAASQAPTAVAVVPGSTPQSTQVTTAFAAPLAVDVRDAAGTLVAGVRVTFTAPGSGPSGTFGSGGTVTVGTNASGRATAPNFVANTLAGSYLVPAQAAGGSSPSTSFSLTNTPGPTHHLAVTAPPSATAGQAVSITVTAQDLYNNTTASYRGTVHFTSSDAQATLPADYAFLAADNGVHSFPVTWRTAGTQTVRATDVATGTVSGTASVTVAPAAASTLSVTGFPSPTTAGSAGTFTVTARDPYGNVASGYRGTVHFTSTDPAATVPADYPFTTADNGAHSFGATLKTAGTQGLTARDTVTASITGTQAGIVVNPAPASTLVVAGFPTSVTAGTAGTFTVTAKDPYGNTATGYRGTLHFTSSDPQAGLPPDYAFVAADNGVHSFSATLKTAGTQTLTARDTVTASITGTQAGIVVNPAAASTLGVAGFPASVTAGTAGTFTVTAKDPYGNVATGYRGTLHFTSSDPQAGLPPDYAFVAADNGVHSFSATLKTAGTQALTARDTVTGSITGTQTGILVNPAAASTLSVTGFPSPTTAGTASTFTVTAKDPYGNTATGYRGTVHFTSTDPAATVPANYTFTAADNGAHLFPATLRTAGTRSLSATDTANGSLTGSQGGIVVNPAGADHIASVVPATVTAGVPFPATLTVQDAYNNTVTTYTGTVHISTNLGEMTNYTFTPADMGSHTFHPALTRAGSRTSTATDINNPSITGTASFVVLPAPVDHLAVAAPASATAGAAFGIRVTAQDAFNNTVGGYLGTVTFTSSDPGAQLPAPYAFTAGDQGVHTFPGGATLITAGGQAITATDTANGGITGSAAVTVNPAAAHHFSLSAPATVTSGMAFDLTLTVQDAFNNTVTGYTGTVHFSSSDADPGVLLPADYTFTGAEGGVATFPGGVTLVTVGNQTVSATDTASGITGSATVTVSAPALGPSTGGRSPVLGTPAAGDALVPVLDALWSEPDAQPWGDHHRQLPGA
jgi:hypothetical protein